jgi:hypothetical protein
MNTNTTTGNEDMKISCRESNDTCHSKPLFVMVSKFDTAGFPVRVRHLQLAPTQVSKTSSGASRLERRRMPQRQPQGKINPIDVGPEPLSIARRVSTF